MHHLNRFLVSSVKHCPSLLFENATLSSTNTEYQSTISVNCKPGYVFSDGTVTSDWHCMSEGNWSGPIEDCQGNNIYFTVTDDSSTNDS